MNLFSVLEVPEKGKNNKYNISYFNYIFWAVFFCLFKKMKTITLKYTN